MTISWAGSIVVQAQTIADAAREERERRKEIESKTSETIPVVTYAGVAPPTTKVKIADEKSQHSRPTDFNGHDEKYWRPKFDAARLGLKHAEDNLKPLDQKVADLNSRLTRINNSTPSIRAALERATHEQSAGRKAVADANQKIADLEDELRRARGLPGWSRPQ